MNRSDTRRGALLVAAWLMLFSGGQALAADPPSDTADTAVQTTAEPEAEQGAPVRVLLTRMQAEQLTVTLDGSYTLEPGGLAFQRGSKLVFVCEGNALTLYYEGMAMRAEGFSLRRHAPPPSAANQENGLRFNGNLNLFSGDLLLTAADATVRPVFTAPMETYLLGVVPYEMSESFPLEALKAQAVTARTYAQRKLEADRDYDVTDNTNDQVYRGFNAAHERAAQAVRETAGLCGYVGGELARGYYSASNGGQTELMQNVWPDGGQELFIARDDPYDLQNPLSQVRSALLPLEWPQAGLDPALDALAELIKPALAEPLMAMGYDGDAAYIRVTGVEKAEVHTPLHPAPSRVMTVLRLWVRVDARKEIVQPSPEPTATPAPDGAAGSVGAAASVVPLPRWTAPSPVGEAIEVDIPLFPEVEALLNLSINAGDNELITVREQEDGFVLEARRFGHGVGMSQRGAEWMAAMENWTFDQILHFYYPGISLSAVTEAATPTLPPPVDAAFLNTPGPPATATPRPTLMPVSETPAQGQWMGLVTAIAEDSTLNLRLEPSTSAKVLKTLYLDQPLLVLAELPDGWLHVKTDALEGYVMAQFVKRAEE